jgi:FPC/CPF motif-containing protein YcgG
VTFFENGPEHRTLEEYEAEFWALLQSVHDLDDDPWPDDIAPDPDHENWEFAFAGMPMFVVVNTPAHRDRASRHFDCLMVTFQPRFVFDDIAEDSRQGRNARTIIRKRLASYDTVPASPLLGSFGTPGNREWRQYFLDDDNSDEPRSTARCPLHVHQKGRS